MRERIGRYEILEELGRGNMGAVYKARDPQIDRIVAIKSILTASLSVEDLEHYKGRFYREAQAAGKMSHPGIVTIHDIAEDENGQPYLVMEFVEGATLSSLLAPPGPGMPAERLSYEQALDIGIQVAQALDYAHRRGVVHRDIKPANVLMTYDGKAKITDFGIAKLEGTQLTQTGTMVGTPAFMSPEQITGSEVDGRSDLFSLGGVLYWMFTGQKPFAGDTVSALSFKIVYEMPVPVKQRNPALPQGVEQILSRCMAKKPEERYKTAGELSGDLVALRDKKLSAVAAPAPKASRVVGATPSPAPAAVPAAAPAPAMQATPKPAGEMPKTPFAPPLPARVVSPAKKAGLDPKMMMGIGGAALVVLVLVVYLLWPSKPETPPSTPAAPSSETSAQPSPAPAQPASKPAPGGAPPTTAAAQSRIPAGMAMLNIECRHDFRTAKLEVYLGETLVAEGALRAAVLPSGQMGEVFRISKPIAPGSQTLRVLLASPLYGFEEEKQITGDFRAGASRTLIINVGISGAERWLSLAWR